MSTDEVWPSDAFGPFSTKRLGNPATSVDAYEVIPPVQCSSSVTPPSPRTKRAYG